MHIFLKLDLLRCVFVLVCIAFVQVLSVSLMVNIKKSTLSDYFIPISSHQFTNDLFQICQEPQLRKC